MRKDFSVYEKKGDEYFYRSFRKNKSAKESLHDLDKAIDKYTTARAVVPYEGFEKSRIIRKIRDAFEERASMRAMERIYAFFSIFAFAITLVFISFNLTGNTIGGINFNDMKWISTCFFFFGLIFVFMYLRNKNRGS